MRTYGVKNEEFQEIKKKFAEFFGDLQDVKIFLFGSRATGKNKLFSDIDLAVKSKSKDLGQRISRFKTACEESNFPYKVDITKEELFGPSQNICAAIRWLFGKKEILQKRLQRSPTWIETIAEYKGLGPDLKKNGHRSLKVMNDFFNIYERYK